MVALWYYLSPLTIYILYHLQLLFIALLNTMLMIGDICLIFVWTLSLKVFHLVVTNIQEWKYNFSKKEMTKPITTNGLKSALKKRVIIDETVQYENDTNTIQSSNENVNKLKSLRTKKETAIQKRTKLINHNLTSRYIYGSTTMWIWLLPVFVLMGARVITRNIDWLTEASLFRYSTYCRSILSCLCVQYIMPLDFILISITYFFYSIHCLTRSAISVCPTSAKALSNHGMFLMSAGDNKEAIEILDRALVLFPTQTSALINIGIALQRDKQYARYGILRNRSVYIL